jgi:adenosylcobinamide-phosphate synthase
MTAISFAVVGSFEEAIDGWRNYQPRFAGDNDGIVLAATAGAVNMSLMGGASCTMDSSTGGFPGATNRSAMQAESLPGQTPELSHLAVVVGLVWRSVVMWMVLLALLTLARLLG